jgi:hypothetical protein
MQLININNMQIVDHTLIAEDLNNYVSNITVAIRKKNNLPQFLTTYR